MQVTIKNVSGAALVPPKPFNSVSLANAATRTDEVTLSGLLANESELRTLVMSKQIELTAPVISAVVPQHDFFELLLSGLTQSSVEKHAHIDLKDASAGAVLKRAILIAGAKGALLKEAFIYALAASAADGTNFGTFTLKIIGIDGSTVVATNVTRATSAVSIAAGKEKLTLAGATLALTEGQALVFESTKAGTGVAFEFALDVMYTDNPTLKAAPTL